MAVVERGKGKNRQIIEIVQYGSTLRMHEVDAGGARLPGYRRFPTADAAKAALTTEVQAHLRDGMKPADDAARAIDAEAPPAKPGKPTLPLRRDIAIYNEANGFVVTSRKMAGKTLDEGSAEWKKAVTRGDMLPISLMQDDPFVIRVVAGEPLSAQEEAEWVARVDWHLNIPDGRLCVTGGAVFTNEDYDDTEAYSEQFVGEVAIPKGRYKASLYTQLHGINGGDVIDHLAGGYDRGEAYDDWFARTRPGQAPPAWDADEGREVVGFLLHLEPIDAAPKNGLSDLPDDGWFGGAENARKPELCPLGLAAKDVQRRVNNESGAWTFVRDTFAMLQPKWGSKTPENLVGGGMVGLPVTRLASAARLAWFASRHAVMELRLQPPTGSRVDLSGDWPEGVVLVEEGATVRVLFSSDLDPVTVMERMAELAPRMAAMPPGTVLDLCAAPVEYMMGTPESNGWLWLRGVVRGDKWSIARALPPVSAEQLESALALASEVESAAGIPVSGQDECNAIVAWAKRNFGDHLKSNPPKAGADAITFKKPGYEVQLVGIAAFATRFGDVWPTWDGGAAADSDDDEDDENDDGMFPTEPIKGALLYTTPAGRTFHQTMALLLSQAIDTEVRAQEKGLKKAGFKEVGDVMCAAFDQIAFHGYARADNTAMAWFRVSYPDQVTCEVVSVFGDGTVLLTSAAGTIENDHGKGAHVRVFPGAAPTELVLHHEKGLAELQAQLGAPRAIGRSVQAMAEVLAAVLAKE